ncbi:MAG: hypothetical protein ACE5I5_06545 [Candidatus Heimdallarchaeota archaeon]
MKTNIRKFRKAFWMDSKEYLRNKTNIILLVLIPFLFITGFDSAMRRLPEQFVAIFVGNLGRVVSAQWSAAILTVILGLSMILSSKDADRRLILAGYRSSEVVFSRIFATIFIGLLATSISFATLFLYFEPRNLPITFSALYVSAMIYGSVGITVGSLIGQEFEGSFAVIFIFMFDAFLGNSSVAGGEAWLSWLPLHYPTRVLQDAALFGTWNGGDMMLSIAYLGVSWIAAAMVFYKATKIH